jgi:hypothetical protein
MYRFSHKSQFKESEMNMALLPLDATYVSGMNIMTVCSQHCKFLAHHKSVPSCKVGKDTAHPYHSYFQYAMLEDKFTTLRTSTINSFLYSFTVHIAITQVKKPTHALLLKLPYFKNTIL